MDHLFALGAVAYGAVTLGFLAALWFTHPLIKRTALWALGVTLLYWLGLLGAWVFQDGDMVRFWLGFSGWTLCALYLLILRRYPLGALGSFVSALATVMTGLAVFVAAPTQISPSVQGLLLRIHIGLAFIGITAFAFATGASLLYLAQSRSLKLKRGLSKRLPPLAVLDRFALRGILIGFPFYTVALLLGSAQAVQAGGGIKLPYILALASWLIYGVVLQARLTAGWRGKRAAMLTVAGLFLALVVVAQYSLGLGR